MYWEQGLQAPENAPTQGAGFSSHRKAPSPTALMCYGSRDHAVPRHEQQERAAFLIRFPKRISPQLYPGERASHERVCCLAWASEARSLPRPSSLRELG